MTVGLQGDWLFPVYSRVGRECFRCYEEGCGGPGEEVKGCDPEQARGQRAGAELRGVQMEVTYARGGVKVAGC